MIEEVKKRKAEAQAKKSPEGLSRSKHRGANPSDDGPGQRSGVKLAQQPALHVGTLINVRSLFGARRSWTRVTSRSHQMTNDK